MKNSGSNAGVFYFPIKIKGFVSAERCRKPLFPLILCNQQ